jgi:thiol-disulfide isomerase/thioredoxin
MKKLFLLFSTFTFAFNALCLAQTDMPSTETVMNNAYTQASKEHKNVMVIFHASWCIWCKKMEASINEPELKKMFDDNYVIVYLDVLEQPAKKNLENPGSTEMLAKYKGNKGGIPFWFIADAKGNELADSQIRPEGASLDTYGNSVGCPAEESEVAYFLKVLKGTSKLNDNQLAMIGKRFAQNKSVPVAKPVTASKPLPSPVPAPR